MVHPCVVWHSLVVMGVDNCGPFYFKLETRNKALQKSDIDVFICRAIKAVWMELTKDLSPQPALLLIHSSALWSLVAYQVASG